MDRLVDAVKQEQENMSLLKTVVHEFKEELPKELIIYFDVKGTEEPIYIFKLEPGEEIKIPIVVKTPLGRITKKYGLGVVIVIPDAKGYSVFGGGGVYIGP